MLVTNQAGEPQGFVPVSSTPTVNQEAVAADESFSSAVLIQAPETLAAADESRPTRSSLSHISIAAVRERLGADEAEFAELRKSLRAAMENCGVYGQRMREGKNHLLVDQCIQIIIDDHPDIFDGPDEASMKPLMIRLAYEVNAPALAKARRMRPSPMLTEVIEAVGTNGFSGLWRPADLREDMDGPITIDNLDFNKFVQHLHDDTNFDHTVHMLVYQQEGLTTIPITTGNVWKAALHEMTHARRGERLSFKIIFL